MKNYYLNMEIYDVIRSEERENEALELKKYFKY